MSEDRTKERRSTFPLPLSSVTGGDRRNPGTPRAPAPVATPQTATRNAARTAFGGGAAQHDVARHFRGGLQLAPAVRHL